MDRGVDISTDPETRDILLHFTSPNKARKHIERAHSENGVYILDFDIPDCNGDLQELIDLIPLHFEHIHHHDWNLPDGRPCVPHHPHLRELALHDPDPDGICRDCHTPTTSTSTIAGCGLAAIAKAEREALPEEGLSNLELETATRVIFGMEEHPLPRPASQHLCGMLRSTSVGTLDAHGVPRPYTKDTFMEIYPHWRDPMAKLTVAEEEELGGGEALANGERVTPADGEPQLVATLADGAPHLAARQVARALPAKAGELHTRTKGGKEKRKKRNLLPAPEPREPTFVPGIIPGTNISYSVIRDREFFALMLTTASEEEEDEEAAPAAVAKAAPVPEEDPNAVRVRNMHTSGFRADDALYHQRLGHPSRVTLKNCIEAEVFAPGALLRTNGIEVRGASHPRSCTICPEAALSHQPFPLLEPGTNCYAKLEVYSDFLNVVEFRSKELQEYLAQKGIEHHISLPYAHQQQGVAERTNRTLMTKRLFLQQFREHEQANANRVYAINGHSYASPEDEAAAAILEQGTRGEFTRGDRRSDEDDNDDSPRGGAGTAGGSGSGRGAAPPAPHEPESDNDDVQEVIPQHRHDSIVSGLQLLGLHTATSIAPRIIEPKNPRQALTGSHSKEWREAMDAKIKALESRHTRVFVDRATIKGRRILSGKWAFRVKTTADGTIERFKARWVVRGYDQRYGIDFDQMFALVSRHTPALHNILLEIGFKQLPHDPGMYRRDFLGKYILLMVYIDDLLYIGSSNELLEQFEKNLAGRVDITCNHDVKQFLGLNISYSLEAIHLSAAKYAEELGKRFNVAPAPLSTPYHTPGPNHKPDNKALSPAGLQTYQQQLGCLLFASVTCRPGLSYIASQQAQYSRKPTTENLLNLQRALQFFISTPNVGLCYSTISTASFNLIGYCPISWNSQKQELVALSSAEVEFIATTAAVREGLNLQELLQEAKIPALPNFRLHCDNQSAIRIVNKPGFVNRTKHIALRYFFVKDEVDKGKVDLTYCPTGDMAADFLTKRLSRQQYEHCSELSGVVKRVKTRYGQK
ncbi:unnamed protein product [Closterium sp. NIES-53]